MSQEKNSSNCTIRMLVYWLLIIDWVCGGTGRVIVIGSVSLRILLCFVAIIIEIYDVSKNGISPIKGSVFWIYTVFYFILNLLVSIIIGNTMSYAIDEMTGYITIIIVPFFIFRFKEDAQLKTKTIKAFYTLIYFFAIFSLFLWLYAFFTGEKNYSNIQSVLDKYSYGSLSYIGKIPRLFLKSSILLTGGLLLSMKKIFCENRTVLGSIEFIVFVLAILTTFTTAFYFFSLLVAACFWLHLQKRNPLTLGGVVKTIIVLLLFFAIIDKTAALKVLDSRFTGNYTFQYKSIQTQQLMDSWLEAPLFGKGFGATINLNYGYRSSVGVYRFEVMWLQLLLHTGIVGFVLFVGYIITIIERCFSKQSKDNTIAFLCGLFLLYVCLVSLSNPFMNNTIGLLGLTIIAGATYSSESEKEQV